MRRCRRPRQEEEDSGKGPEVFMGITYTAECSTVSAAVTGSGKLRVTEGTSHGVWWRPWPWPRSVCGISRSTGDARCAHSAEVWS